MSERKAILVVGDLMIDRTWVVPNKSSIATSQAHDGIPPRKLINPLWQTDVLGAAGFVARAALSAAPGSKIHFAGGWQDSFNPSEFLSPEDKAANPQPRISFIRAATTPFNTEKFRIYEDTAEEPRLVYRFDRDLSDDRGQMYKVLAKDDIWPPPEEVAVVIVSDFAKGLLDSLLESKEIRAKLQEYGERPFLLDTKRASNDKVFTDLPWTLALPNREELARLVGLDAVEPPSFRPSGDNTYALNPRLAESLLKFCEVFPTSKEIPQRNVLVKLDREGALLYERNFGATDRLTALVLPSDQKKVAGIGAGDVLAAHLAAKLIGHISGSPSLDYSKVCAEAIPAATAFCMEGTAIRHSQDGLKKWYGVGLTVSRAITDKVKAGFKTGTLEALSESASVLVVRDKQDLTFREVLAATNATVSIRNATWFLDGFITVDKDLGYEILRLRSQFRAYFEAQDPNAKPFVAALCGKPGSGKSALADALPKAFDCDVIKANAAQWTSVDDLFRLCEEIRTVGVKRGKPFVFIDEVDTAVGGEKLYGKLLAPLADGAYSSFGYTRQFGPAIFLLAGSNDPWDTKDKLLGEISEKEHPKLRDLVSRLSSPPTQVPALEERRLDALYLAAFLLHSRFPGIKKVQRGVLKLLCGSVPKHGPRSLKTVVGMFSLLKDPTCVTTDDLKNDMQGAIELHFKDIIPGWREDREPVEIVP